MINNHLVGKFKKSSFFELWKKHSHFAVNRACKNRLETQTRKEFSLLAFKVLDWGWMFILLNNKFSEAFQF